MLTKVISGFPGVGKSVLAQREDIQILDSDSSKFSWIEEGVRHPDFPANYIEHILDNMGKADYIMVSSHKVVRDALRVNEIPYTLVYPSIELRKEYVNRYFARGNEDVFISFMDMSWYTFIRDIETETFPALIKLESGQYLSDVI